MPEARRAVGPGRVNLIGDHTDYNHGRGPAPGHRPRSHRRVHPHREPDARGGLLGLRPAGHRPAGLRSRHGHGSGVVRARLGPPGGGRGRPVPCPTPAARSLSESTLPVGSGLSSSAAVSVALAEVFGGPDTAEEIARLCQRAEHAVGVPVGLMDPLVCAGGRAGHALLIDFDTLDVLPVARTRRRRDRGGRQWAARGPCGPPGTPPGWPSAAPPTAVVGPLGRCRPADLAAVLGALRRSGPAPPGPPRRHRVCPGPRHRRRPGGRRPDRGGGTPVGEPPEPGRRLRRLHPRAGRGWRPTWRSTPGVFGARMTGAGFGGCVVALTRPGAVDTGGVAHAGLGRPGRRRDGGGDGT